MSKYQVIVSFDAEAAFYAKAVQRIAGTVNELAEGPSAIIANVTLEEFSEGELPPLDLEDWSLNVELRKVNGLDELMKAVNDYAKTHPTKTFVEHGFIPPITDKNSPFYIDQTLIGEKE